MCDVLIMVESKPDLGSAYVIRVRIGCVHTDILVHLRLRHMRFINQGLDCKCTFVSLIMSRARGVLDLFPFSFAMLGWCERLKESDLLVDKLFSCWVVSFCQNKLAQSRLLSPHCEDLRPSPHMLQQLPVLQKH